MVEKDGGVYIGTRVPQEFKDEIEARFVGKDREYQTMSDFLRALIDERMDPEKADRRDEEKFIRMLERPSVQEYLRSRRKQS